MQYVDGDVNIEFLKTKASVDAQQVDKIDGKLMYVQNVSFAVTVLYNVQRFSHLKAGKNKLKINVLLSLNCTYSKVTTLCRNT